MFYEGVAPDSFHIDCGAVDSALPGEVRKRIAELKRQVRRTVNSALEKLWFEERGIHYNFDKYWLGDDILELNEVTIHLGVAVEDDGETEEWCEV